MPTKRPPILIAVLLLLALGAGLFYYLVIKQADSNTPLTASGSVEASEVILSPELSGKVTEVDVAEGDAVQASEVLFRMDTTLLQAQRAAAAAALETAQSAVDTAEAAVASAQAQHDLVLFNALATDQANRTADWSETRPADFDQPTWYYSRSEQLTAVQGQVDAAQTELQKANDDLTYIRQTTASRAFVDVEKRLLAARQRFQAAQAVLDRVNQASDGREIKDAAQTEVDIARADLDNLQRLYDAELTSDGATKVLEARARQQVAQENFDTLHDQLRALQTGENSPQVAQAQKAVDQAQAAARQAHTAVTQSQANLDLIDAQIAKMSVAAPANGVVLTRNIEPGEVAAAGSSALVLARLDDLTITVYIPEDRYGEIRLGQAASVAVDSFPNESFPATVINIADKAEFTPRNVQTVAGRKTTVFAIKLQVENPAGKLKYGMPADVTFH
jgi:HlyD family secretion protein